MNYIGIILLWIFKNNLAQGVIFPGCCPSWATDGSYNPSTGKCYRVSDYKTNWTNSQTACQGLGAVLGIVDTVDDANFVNRLRGGEIWMGVNDLDNEGVFTQNGKNLTTTMWKDNQPNGETYDDGQDCVIMDSNKKWQDKRCTDDNYHFLCEWPVVKDHSGDMLKFMTSSDTSLCDHDVIPPGKITVKSVIHTISLWPMIILFHFTNVEVILWSSLPWLWIAASVILYIAHQILITYVPYISYPLFTGLGLALGIPFSALSDFLWKNKDFSGMKIAALILIVLGLLLILLPESWCNVFLRWIPCGKKVCEESEPVGASLRSRLQRTSTGITSLT